METLCQEKFSNFHSKDHNSLLIAFQLPGLWVKNGKRLFYSQTMIVTILCKMEFKDFPLDSQVCRESPMELLSKLLKIILKS